MRIAGGEEAAEKESMMKSTFKEPRRARALNQVGMMVALLACRSVETLELPPSASAATAVAMGVDPTVLQSRREAPYERARWRIGDWNDLENVALWGAHILIRHRDSRTGYVFSTTPSVADGLASRSRQEALVLARDVARSVRVAPDEFARLAREHSDDRVTSAQGGVLGVFMASQLLPWPNVLDAFAALRPGDVSEVVETNFGFHVFRRLPPPPEDRVTGAAIVIGHNDVPVLARVLGKSLPGRSRDEALGLAREVFRSAQANPSQFGALVQQYSEHPTAVRRGDLGTWSTREPSALGPHIEQLRRLSVGDVAPPLDTPYGYVIIQRQSEPARAEYAVDAVELPYDFTLADEHPRSRRATLDAAASLLTEVKMRPERFLEYQREECCLQPKVWQDGRGFPHLTNAVEGLRVGELAAAPIDTGFSVFVVRRIAVPPRQKGAPGFELPSPAAPDFGFLAAHRSRMFRETLAGVVEGAEGLLATLPESGRARFMNLHADAALGDEGSPEQRRAAFASMQRELEELMGNPLYLRYREVLRERFEHQLLVIEAY